MSEPTEPSGKSESPKIDEDQTIRERVRELTATALQQGRIDSEAVKDIVRSVTGAEDAGAKAQTAESRLAFADTVNRLDEALMASTTATHDSLARLASRGKDFSDNDLKEALVSLKQLEEAYVAVASHVAEATTGGLRDELIDLAVHAQKVGADAGSRVASIMSEFAGRIGAMSRENATFGLGTARTYGARMALLTSGILAGIGDALRDKSETKKGD